MWVFVFIINRLRPDLARLRVILTKKFSTMEFFHSKESETVVHGANTHYVMLLQSHVSLSQCINSLVSLFFNYIYMVFRYQKFEFCFAFYVFFIIFFKQLPN